MNLFFVSLYIIFVSILVSPAAASSDSYDSNEELTTDIDSEEFNKVKRKKPKRIREYIEPQFNLTGNLRKRFAIELFLSNGIQNMACSPVSALMPLAKLMIGARGQCETELLSVIGIAKSEINQTFKNIIEQLKYLPGVKLNVASRIYVSDKFHTNATFNSEASQIFGSVLKKVNFDDAKGTALKINSWVAKETGKSTEIQLDFKVSGSESAVLVNVVTFVGNWKQSFTKFKSQPFYSQSGVIFMSMMQQRGTYNYGLSSRLEAQLIEIPYEKEKASFVIVLPLYETGLLELLEKLKTTPELLNDAMEKMLPEGVELTMPKFKIQFKQDLKPIYKSVGLRDIFKNKSGLTGIIEGQELIVSSAQQVTIIDVNEQGTEAAAATAMNMVGAAQDVDQNYFKANRPFLFYIKSQKEQIFAGVYAGP